MLCDANDLARWTHNVSQITNSSHLNVSTATFRTNAEQTNNVTNTNELLQSALSTKMSTFNELTDKPTSSISRVDAITHSNFATMNKLRCVTKRYPHTPILTPVMPRHPLVMLAQLADELVTNPRTPKRAANNRTRNARPPDRHDGSIDLDHRSRHR